MMNARVINLLSELQSVTIECDKPYLDGYGPDNLLKSDSRGFTVERFIRPPITLTIRFPCSVRLHSIQINNTRGSFISTGFEIRACSGEKGEVMPVYKPVGKAFDCAPGEVKFISRKLHRKSAYPQTDDKTPKEYNLFSHDSTLLYRCRGVTITITRAWNSLPAVVAGLSIHGVPLDSTFIKPRKQIETKLHDQPSVQQPYAEETLVERYRAVDPTTTASTATDTPEEFNDALTHNLMSYPITLPSGKVIDQTSLDKIYNSACTFGRQPVDPFTGVKLSDTYKPVANHLLRERIDKYVSVHNITTVGRTTGIKRKHTSPSTNFKHSRPKLEGETLKMEKGTNSGSVLSQMDQRIQRLLDKSSKFRTVSLESEATKAACKQCLKVAGKEDSMSTFYTLSCSHLICKACALREGRFVTCNACSRRTATCDLKVFRQSST